MAEDNAYMGEKPGAAPGQQPPGQYPPGQQYPPPGQQYPPPGQQYPPPGQQYPPPGQYPPGGQYPPPQGQQQQPYGGYPPPQPGAPNYNQPPPGQYPPPQQPPYYGGGPPAPPQQPQQQAQWMTRPTGIPGCPPGLEYLTQIDQVLVQQTVELLEAFTGWETANRYVLRNSMSQQIYYASEESDMCARQCCAARRGFVMHITDNLGQEVLRANRDFKCCAGPQCCAACDPCQMTMTVESPPGTIIGYIRQQLSCLPPCFDVMDENEQVVVKIEGPACMFCPQFCEQKFEVQTPDGQMIGDITKQFSGLIREMYTTADNFGVKFPLDLSVKVKATLLAAVFLIDFMYFEQPPNQN